MASINHFIGNRLAGKYRGLFFWRTVHLRFFFAFEMKGVERTVPGMFMWRQCNINQPTIPYALKWLNMLIFFDHNTSFVDPFGV